MWAIDNYDNFDLQKNIMKQISQPLHCIKNWYWKAEKSPQSSNFCSEFTLIFSIQIIWSG